MRNDTDAIIWKAFSFGLGTPATQKQAILNKTKHMSAYALRKFLLKHKMTKRALVNAKRSAKLSNATKKGDAARRLIKSWYHKDLNKWASKMTVRIAKLTQTLERAILRYNQHKTTPADNKTNFFWSEAHNAFLDLLVFIRETKLWNKRRSGPFQTHEVDQMLPMITRAYESVYEKIFGVKTEE